MTVCGKVRGDVAFACEMTERSLESEIKKLDKSLELLLGECLENDLSEQKVYQLIQENVCKRATAKMNQINRTKNLFAFSKIFFATLLLSYLLTRKPITTDILKMLGRKMLIGVSVSNKKISGSWNHILLI